MRKSRYGVILVGAALAASSVAVVPSVVHGSAGTASYVVLASDAASVDAAIAEAQAAGGQVVKVNRAIGLITVTADAASFEGAVAGASDVAGVARNTPIGSLPAEAKTIAATRWSSRVEAFGEANAASSGGHHDDEGHDGDHHKASRAARPPPVGHADDACHSRRLVRRAAGSPRRARRDHRHRASTAPIPTSPATSTAS